MWVGLILEPQQYHSISCRADYSAHLEILI